MLIEDAARVRDRTFGTALRRVPRARPVVDRRDLRNPLYLVEHVKHRVRERNVDDLKLRQRFLDLLVPVVPRNVAPEVISPQETASQEVVAQVRRLIVVEI